MNFCYKNNICFSSFTCCNFNLPLSSFFKDYFAACYHSYVTVCICAYNINACNAFWLFFNLFADFIIVQRCFKWNFVSYIAVFIEELNFAARLNNCKLVDCVRSNSVLLAYREFIHIFVFHRAKDRFKHKPAGCLSALFRGYFGIVCCGI